MNDFDETSFPQAILHLDADAFFASVEAAKNPKLRGKPVVTGHERGIATSMSYEAKRLGVTRGMPVFKIKKEFPNVLMFFHLQRVSQSLGQSDRKSNHDMDKLIHNSFHIPKLLLPHDDDKHCEMP